MKILLKLLVAIWITSCNAQIQKTKQMTKKLTDIEIKEEGYKIKKEDSIFMIDGILDIVKLEQIGSPSDASVPTDEGWEQTVTYYYDEILDDGTNIQVSGNKMNGYRKSLRKRNSLFEITYNYYNSGELKNVSNNYVKRFSKGISYLFDNKGDIENYENHENHYEFSWEDIQSFLKAEKIEEKDIQNIYRGELDGIHGWEIIYIPQEFKKTDKAKVLTLDSKTGEILNTEIRDTSVHLD